MRLILQTLLILLCGASIGACNPFKVTDPHDPNFDPMKFKFGFSREKEVEVFKVIFPIGTKKEFVDQVLIEAGNARLLSSDDLPNTHLYIIPEIITLLIVEYIP